MYRSHNNMKAIQFHVSIAFTIAFIGTIFAVPPVDAQTNCLPLYGGGVTSQQYCISPTATPTPEVVREPGGVIHVPVPQKIYPAPRTKTTPNTGPEDWTFPFLLLLGGLGLLLKKKAKTLA